MRLLNLLTTVGLTSVVSLSCGQLPKSKEQTVGPVVRPLAVIIEKEISGVLAGLPLQAPAGLAEDRQQTLYVVDAGNNRLLSFSSHLDLEHEVGGYGSNAGLFDRPGFLAVDNDLNIWVSDVGNDRIVRFDMRLQYVDEISLSDRDDPLKFRSPSGLAVTEYGELWMCDRENSRVAVFNNIGQFDRFVGEYGYGGGQLRIPEKVIRIPGDSFLVCDAGNRRLALYDQYGNFGREIFDRALEFPVAAAMSPAGLIWLLDQRTNQIICYTRSGDHLLSVGPVLPGSTLPLREPSDIIVTRDGHLLISDTGNNRMLLCMVAFESD